ncbi:phage minor head protein [uncultured Lamprocystis sp.]|jgi:hypothetical protein|uniref:phage minor head protein n=1 Tax=uncultured Lamprocystis sp. TaxID=543132 RepID=UPI0025EC0AC1|nr:phage minor head protein [uncultured Lamprocystis sp.]
MADYGSLPFAEQIAFFKDKLDLPTERWDDLLGAAHDRAFVVAGATGADLLADLHAAVRKGIEDGTTLAEFRRDFERIVAARGWTGFTGSDSAAGIAWRTRVIYETNLRTSYAAGRWQQIQAVKADRPYLEYRHSESVLNPRPLHQSWDGLVLPADDPWWQTHYPPNGWGCKCRVFALNDQDLERLGKAEPDRAPDDGERDWKDSRGVVHQVPNGIDPGWDYAPGAHAKAPLRDLFERRLADLPAPIGAEMAAVLRPAIAAEQAAHYRDWLTRLATDPRAKSERPIVGALHVDDLNWLAQAGKPLPQTAEIAMGSGPINGPKAARHAADGDALTPQVWEYLPELLEAPLAVCYDEASGHLLYILPEATTRRPQLAVEFDYRRKDRANVIVSGYRPQRDDLLARVANGTLRLIRGEL